MKTILATLLALIAALPLAAQAAEYEIDPAHSFARFDISYGGFARAYGNFSAIEGTVTFDEANLAASSMDITIRTASVWTGNRKRDEHLRSPDFFNVKQYPVMTFKSKSITKSDDGYAVTGDLTIHGVTKEITVDFRIVGSIEGSIGGEASFTLKRSDYGIDFMLDRLGDEVHVEVAILGKQ